MGGSCRQIGIIQIVKRKAGVYYTKNGTFMVYFTPSKVRFLSYNIHGDSYERKEVFRYEAAMSMQKKGIVTCQRSLSVSQKIKEDDVSCGMKNQSFRRDSHFRLRKGKVKNWQNGGKSANIRSRFAI